MKYGEGCRKDVRTTGGNKEVLGKVPNICIIDLWKIKMKIQTICSEI